MGVRQALERALANRSDRAFWTNETYKYLLAHRYRCTSKSTRDLMDRDWDTAIILDACRYDTLKECLPEYWPRVDRIRSRAGNTHDFYRANFQDSPYPDTVVVTANPRTVRLEGDSFHDIDPVYEDAWDEDTGTVWPDVMAERTIEAHERHPRKRIISHWIQPHYPFVGSELLDGYQFGEEPVWNDVMRGHVSVERVYRAYRETLEMALPHVRRVLDAVDGKVVVTSDHGNAFGERPWWSPVPIYGHPRGIKHPALVEVPWLVPEFERRREIEAGEIASVAPSAEAQDQLRALGYTDS